MTAIAAHPSTLSGVRVLDFTTLLPGPFATMMLADLGADVLRVESPTRPDLARLREPFDDGQSAFFGTIGRNKRSIAIDLKHPLGVQIVRRLARGCDVVVEQFRPGVMERLGLGHAALLEENPRLVYCSITGYGQSGPYRDRAGHDINYLALAGVMSYSGRAEEGPAPYAVQVADIGGSYNAVVGILAALIQRERTGRGQAVDIAMHDGAIAWGIFEAPSYLVGGRDPRPEAELLNGGGIYDFYRTRDGRYLAVGCLEPQFFAAFARALGHPEWAEEWTADFRDTARHKPEIAAILAGRTLAEWREVFAQVDACVEPVLTVSEMVEHPQVVARGMIVEVPKVSGGVQRQIACPIRFSAASTRASHAGVPLGMHTEEILREFGYEEAEIRRMRETGVFGDAVDRPVRER